jgi:hypothetical protein
MTEGWTGTAFVSRPIDNLVSHIGMVPGTTPGDFGADFYLAQGIRPLVSNTKGTFFDDVYEECSVAEAGVKNCNAPPQQFCNGFKCPAGALPIVNRQGKSLCVSPTGLVTPK